MGACHVNTIFQRTRISTSSLIVSMVEKSDASASSPCCLSPFSRSLSITSSDSLMKKPLRAREEVFVDRSESLFLIMRQIIKRSCSKTGGCNLLPACDSFWIIVVKIKDSDVESKTEKRDRTSEQYHAAGPIQCSHSGVSQDKQPIAAAESRVALYHLISY